MRQYPYKQQRLRADTTTLPCFPSSSFEHIHMGKICILSESPAERGEHLKVVHEVLCVRHFVDDRVALVILLPMFRLARHFYAYRRL